MGRKRFGALALVSQVWGPGEGLEAPLGERRVGVTHAEKAHDCPHEGGMGKVLYVGAQPEQKGTEAGVAWRVQAGPRFLECAMEATWPLGASCGRFWASHRLG